MWFFVSRHRSQTTEGCWVATGALPVSPQCFILYRDDVATEGPLLRLRRPRQEVRVAIGAWLGPRNFGLR